MNIQLIHIATIQKYYLLNGASFRTNYINCHLFMGKEKKSAMTLLYTSESRDLLIWGGGGGWGTEVTLSV